MPGKDYSLHVRTTPKGRRIYYVQFRLPSGKWGTPKSTGETARGRAEAWAIAYLQKGRVLLKDNIVLKDFTGQDFFAYGNEWELNKRVSGRKSPSPRWCLERTDLLKNHILPALGEYRLTRITENVITEYRNNLYSGKMGRAYSGGTTNKILFALRDILKSAYKKGLIQAIPDFELAGVEERKRGKLTRDEATRLFAISWREERAYIASMIAAVTGARLSEIQALRVGDIREDGTFTICKAWDRRTGTVKPRTKSGATREARLPQAHFTRLLQYLALHPFRESNGFLIYCDRYQKDVPASDTLIMRPFHEALAQIGIPKEERRRRGICFHSWRYYCNSALIEAGQPEALIRERIGHTEESMTRRYYRSENIDGFLEALEQALPLQNGEEIKNIN